MSSEAHKTGGEIYAAKNRKNAKNVSSVSANKPGEEAVRLARLEKVFARKQFLEVLYQSHWSHLCAWLRKRYGAGPPEPEDIAQTAFAKMAALDDIDHIRDPRAFLFSVASATAVSGVRWLINTRKFIDGELKASGIAVEEITPERTHIAKEHLEKVMGELKSLTDQQREIIIRSRLRGQTYEEIKAETGWSVSTISRQLKVALIKACDANDGEVW